MSRIFRLMPSLLCSIGLMTLATGVRADNILVVNGLSVSSEPNTVIDITDNLQATCFLPTDTVTVSDTPPASLTGYDQIWDIRYSDASPLSVADQAAYTAFLQSGKKMFVMGEQDSFMTRNTSILDWIDDLGGGTLTFDASAASTQTVNPPYNTTPNVLTSVTYDKPGGVTTPGTGQWITNNGASGSAVMWTTGTLGNATAGALAAVFDVNFMQAAAPGNPLFLKNLCAAVAAGGYSIPTTASPAAVPVGGGWWGLLLSLALATLAAFGWRRKSRA